MRLPITDLPDTSRLWSFHTATPLTAEQEQHFRSRLESFLATWAAHRKEMHTAYELREGQLLLVAVDDSHVGPSGCSIDALVHELQAIEQEMGVELIDAPDVLYRRNDGTLAAATRPGFRTLAESGEVNNSTVVFDRTAQRLGDLREGRFELPASQSWHAKAFPLGASSVGKAA